MYRDSKLSEGELKVLALLRSKLEHIEQHEPYKLEEQYLVIEIEKEDIAKAFGSTERSGMHLMKDLAAKLILWTGVNENKDEFSFSVWCESIVWDSTKSFCEFYVSNELLEFFKYCLDEILKD